MPILFFLFIVIPILEIALIVQVGSSLGTLATILLMVLTAAVGASLVKSEGLHTMTSIRQSLQQGQLPDRQIAEGLLLAIGGVLLITPGFLTDIVGLLCVTPLSRSWCASRLIQIAKLKFVSAAQPDSFTYHHRHSHNKHQNGQTIDGEFTHKD